MPVDAPNLRQVRSRHGGSSAPADGDLEDLELDLLLTAVARRYGYDFRGYARESVRRRVRRSLAGEAVATISELQSLVLHDRDALDRFVASLSVHVTGFFRDASFFVSLREHVLPVLRTYPFTRIWLAGCSTGEEAWSVAATLAEEGLYDRCRIYATDVSHELLKRAREGVYPRASFEKAIADYRESGGQTDPERWITETKGGVAVHEGLRPNLLFTHHNLVTDASFNEFQLIVCRNTLIYFEPPLRARAYGVLHGSLRLFGLLAVGERETLAHTALSSDYDPVAPCLYRRSR